MPRTLQLSFEVPMPLATQESHHGITVDGWAPFGSEHAIETFEDGLSYRFVFDRDCASENLTGDLPRIVDLVKVKIIVSASNLPEPLLELIEQQGIAPQGKRVGSPELQSQFEKLGNTIYSTALKKLNRIVGYIRTRKAQYWLAERQINTDRMQAEMNEFRAIARINDGEPFRWKPSNRIIFSLRFEDENRYLTRDDWDQVREFVEDQARTDLVEELLAGAEVLRADGHRRGSLTEAVTALEVALRQFKPSAEIERKWLESYGDRFEAKGVPAHVEHLGFSGSLKFLLPTILSEEQASTSLLRTCQEAVERRNGVVHKGSRTVDESSLYKYLAAIREMCSTLTKLSANDVRTKKERN